MTCSFARRSLACLLLIAAMLVPRGMRAEDLSQQAVLNAIDRAKAFLAGQQQSDGSWSAIGGRYEVGVTSLALLALLNAGMEIDEPTAAKGLDYLRSVKEPSPSMTYEISLMIMALAAADDGQRDKPRILTLAQKLEDSQIKNGEDAGTWSYGIGDLGVRRTGDRSNGQFAILGLRDAAHAGIPVDRVTWERARRHWIVHQNNDGGWGYAGWAQGNRSTGSMTVAGIATLEITKAMLGRDDELKPDGTPDCCADSEPDESLNAGLRWMANHFAVGHNPGSAAWLLYYLYGMERAGRLSGRRFFGLHDWYREGAQFLVERQNRRNGSWPGVGAAEADPVIGTSFALLFLSKGLSPVLFNKLSYGPRDPVRNQLVQGDNWNRHPDDVRNLTNLISGLDDWPNLVTWQIVDILKVVNYGGVNDLLQAPILYISGSDAADLAPRQIELLTEYVNRGGFIFAVANCDGEGFDQSFREMIRRMYPAGDARLERLRADHPVYRAEYLLDPETVELWGVDFGCRTAIIYSPDDLACLWDRWMRQDPPNRSAQLKSMITRATRVGVNVAAYATGREPPQKLRDLPEDSGEEASQDVIERGLLQIAKLRHTGGWDAAPQALRNLLLALNRTVGLAASTRPRNLPASDPNIFNYPLLYMHGRNRFQIGQQERERLKEYLERGGVLFADACCGSRAFDESFRDLTAQLYPDKQLQRIPPDHEMFSNTVAFDLSRVKRRTTVADAADAALDTEVSEVEPFLEGIEIEGRYALIYSKYDISCALQRQASVACEGYVTDDAVKIAINVVLYSLLQDVRYAELVR